MDKEFGFVSLAALTANVVRWLELSEQHQEHRERQTGRQRDDEQHAEGHVDGVERDLNKRPAT
jgi:hypothetical protein